MISGIIYFCIFAFVSLYSFIFSADIFKDFAFLFITFFVFFTRTLYSGECFISYYIKKYEDEDYEAGDGDCLDIIDMFGENYSNMMTQIMNILRIIGIITFYRVLKRQDFNTFEIFFFIISYVVYTYNTSNINDMSDKNKKGLHTLFTFIFSIIIFFILIKLYKKSHSFNPQFIN